MENKSHDITTQILVALNDVPFAKTALSILEKAHHEAWLVGGFVRDALLGKSCTDIDIATSASWQETQQAFETLGYKTYETGVAHGTITVLIDKHPIEITTYRNDGCYTDSRHPDHVSFVNTIEEDLARRDFTINAIAFHPIRGVKDPFKGIDDLKEGVIRTVGDPARRFSEDALRILRGCRFSSQLGFAIEAETFKKMRSNKGLLSRISAERITAELEKLIVGKYAGPTLLATVDILAAVLPELVAMKGFNQCNPHHIYDVLEHTAQVIQGVPPYPLVRWAALFHDIGKPATFFTDEGGVGHFYGHATVSVMLTRGIIARLAMPAQLGKDILKLVERHDNVIESTHKSIKRELMQLGGDTHLFCALCDLKQGDARGQAASSQGRIAAAQHLKEILEEIIAEQEAFSLKSLAIDGHTVTRMGASGPAVGRVLNATLDAVIEETVPNDKKALENFVAQWLTAHKNVL